MVAYAARASTFRFTGGGLSLWRESVDCPIGVGIFRIQESIVDAIAAALPEFHGLGLDAVATPK